MSFTGFPFSSILCILILIFLYMFHTHHRGSAGMGKVGMIAIAAVVIVVVLIIVFMHSSTPPMGPGPSAIDNINNGTTQPTPTALAPDAQSASTTNATASNNGTNAATMPVAAPSALFTSSTDGFSVDFPGHPEQTASDYTSPLTGKKIPETEYKQSFTNGSGTTYYSVKVYGYAAALAPSIYLKEVLKEYAASAAAKYSGATMSDPQSTTVQGKAALSAVIAIPSHGQNYVVATENGGKTYIIGTYGISEDNYTAFIHSFSFAQ